MKIIIFGAAGFMGSHLLDYLSKDHDVIGVDNYSIGRYKHDKIIKADCLEKEAMDRIIGEFKPEIIYFLTAWAHEGLSQFQPILITENNYNAYLNVLVPAIKHKVKRIVLTSSMSVYGAQKPPFDEDMARKPEDIYAISKTAMEEATEIMSKVYGFEYNIIRPHNVYGPRQALHDPYRNVVAIFINKMLQGKSFYIYGDGEQKRSFSYIDDVTPALANAGLYSVHGEIINIGPTEEYTINRLAGSVRANFENAPLPIHIEDRPQEVKEAWCTNDKAKRLLGYETKTTFIEGIHKMCEWAKTIGYQVPVYLNELELTNENTPITWREHLI